MKRSPLSRKSRLGPGRAATDPDRRMRNSTLQRGRGPARRTRLRQVNPARKAKRHQEQFGPHADWVRSLPCAVAGCDLRPQAAHVKSRGAGGTAVDLVPLCWLHHREQHDIGIRSFEDRYDLDLRALTDHLAEISPALNDQSSPSPPPMGWS